MHTDFRELIARAHNEGPVAPVRPGSLISTDLGQPCFAGVERAAVAGDPALALRLLEEFGLTPDAGPGETDCALTDLISVLAADYREVPGFPSIELARELRRIVDNFVRPYGEIWNCWQDRRSLDHLQRVFNWGDVVVNTQPYLQGAGLSLWGFSTETRARGRRKFVIYLNTAHERSAVAATIGHELGHYIYGAIPRRCAKPAAMGDTFAQHLGDDHELFADAVVAISAYSHIAIREVVGRGRTVGDGTDPRVVGQFRKALAVIDPHYRIELSRARLTAAWRIRYLTLMVHFFKLRCALLEATGT